MNLAVGEWAGRGPERAAPKEGDNDRGLVCIKAAVCERVVDGGSSSGEPFLGRLHVSEQLGMPFNAAAYIPMLYS